MGNSQQYVRRSGIHHVRFHRFQMLKFHGVAPGLVASSAGGCHDAPENMGASIYTIGMRKGDLEHMRANLRVQIALRAFVFAFVFVAD